MPAGDVLSNTAVATRVGTAQATADSAAITTTQVATMTLTCFLESGKTYALTGWARISSSVTADAAIVRVREDSISGTELAAGQVGVPTTSTVGWSVSIYGQYTAVATGNKTFVFAVIRNSGTGNILHRASATAPGWLTCDLIAT